MAEELLTGLRIFVIRLISHVRPISPMSVIREKSRRVYVAAFCFKAHKSYDTCKFYESYKKEKRHLIGRQQIGLTPNVVSSFFIGLTPNSVSSFFI